MNLNEHFRHYLDIILLLFNFNNFSSNQMFVRCIYKVIFVQWRAKCCISRLNCMTKLTDSVKIMTIFFTNYY